MTPNQVARFIERRPGWTLLITLASGMALWVLIFVVIVTLF